MQKGRRHVYIIDDDASVRKALSRLMRSSGYLPETFGSGEEFLAQSGFEPETWVICDLSMPGIDGLEVYRRARLRKLDLGFVFVTAIVDNGRVKEAEKLGAALFRKPVDADSLLSILALPTARSSSG